MHRVAFEGQSIVLAVVQTPSVRPPQEIGDGRCAPVAARHSDHVNRHFVNAGGREAAREVVLPVGCAASKRRSGPAEAVSWPPLVAARCRPQYRPLCRGRQRPGNARLSLRRRGPCTLPLPRRHRAATRVACAARKAASATQRGAGDAPTPLPLPISSTYAHQPLSGRGQSAALNLLFRPLSRPDLAASIAHDGSGRGTGRWLGQLAGGTGATTTVGSDRGVKFNF